MEQAVRRLTETRSQSDADHENFVKKIQDIYGTFSTASELAENIQVCQFRFSPAVTLNQYEIIPILDLQEEQF